MPSKHNVIGHEWKVAETLFIQVYFDVIGMNRKRDIFPMGLFKNELESLFDIFIQRPALSYSYFAFAKWRKIIPRKHFPSDVGRSPSLIERAKRERERKIEQFFASWGRAALQQQNQFFCCFRCKRQEWF